MCQYYLYAPLLENEYLQCDETKNIHSKLKKWTLQSCDWAD